VPQPAGLPNAPADYQRIFETISEGLIIHDAASFLVVEANPAAAVMHGYDRAAFIGLHPTSFIHPDSHPLLGEYSQTVQAGGRFEALAIHLRRDGSPFYVEVRGTPFECQGRPCLLSVLRDVTARIQAEQELQQQVQTLATLQERQRLAQNLHDAVNQSLFSAGLIAEVLPRLWEQNPAEGRRSLEDLRRLTRGALAEMRGLLAELRPQVLIDSELGDLLRQLGNAFTGRTNIPVAVTVVGQGDLPADVQVAFYRLCQEAFNNIAKHARASQVRLQLQYGAGTVELQICDDGRGFDPDHTPSGHYGLSMMHERAGAVGARLIVKSRPKNGTEIAIHWMESGEERAP
ncbi:MAG: PAS domain-containing sensor histidine kinase, partial [Chloroflexi bacterium]|nr:PAS domain-containing sensor histidine kinase [Chloroflexota bacterium]